jgi:hypothetical protein
MALALLALVVAISGSALAAGYVITNLGQIKPSVVKQLQGGPGYAVFNDKGLSTGNGDYQFHRLATLSIPSSGNYVAQAKVVATNTSFGFGEQIGCKLTAHTRSGGTDDFDSSLAETEAALDATIPLEVVHPFSGRGSITLACRLQEISFAPGQTGGVSVRYTYAKIIATRLTSLKNTPVVH